MSRKSPQEIRRERAASFIERLERRDGSVSQLQEIAAAIPDDVRGARIDSIVGLPLLTIAHAVAVVVHMNPESIRGVLQRTKTAKGRAELLRPDDTWQAQEMAAFVDQGGSLLEEAVLVNRELERVRRGASANQGTRSGARNRAQSSAMALQWKLTESAVLDPARNVLLSSGGDVMAVAVQALAETVDAVEALGVQRGEELTDARARLLEGDIARTAHKLLPGLKVAVGQVDTLYAKLLGTEPGPAMRGEVQRDVEALRAELPGLAALHGFSLADSGIGLSGATRN